MALQFKPVRTHEVHRLGQNLDHLIGFERVPAHSLTMYQSWNTLVRSNGTMTNREFCEFMTTCIWLPLRGSDRGIWHITEDQVTDYFRSIFPMAGSLTNPSNGITRAEVEALSLTYERTAEAAPVGTGAHAAGILAPSPATDAEGNPALPNAGSSNRLNATVALPAGWGQQVLYRPDVVDWRQFIQIDMNGARILAQSRHNLGWSWGAAYRPGADDAVVAEVIVSDALPVIINPQDNGYLLWFITMPSPPAADEWDEGIIGMETRPNDMGLIQSWDDYDFLVNTQDVVDVLEGNRANFGTPGLTQRLTSWLHSDYVDLDGTLAQGNQDRMWVNPTGGLDVFMQRDSIWDPQVRRLGNRIISG